MDITVDGVSIWDLNVDQLHDVYEVYRKAKSILDQKKVMEFKVGDSASFVHNSQTLMGRVTKINPKTIVVKVGHVNWKCSPGLIKKVEPVLDESN